MNDIIIDAWGDKFKKCCGNCDFWEQSWSDEGDCTCKAPNCPRNYFADNEPCSYFEATEWPCFGLIEN